MSFWLASLLLIAPSAIFVLWPVLRQSNVVLDRTSSAMEIFRDQLAEVARDEARGIISGAEARSAEAEIKRRMLAAKRDEKATTRDGSGGWLLGVIAVVIPLGGAVLYTYVGQPGVPSLPFAAREQERDDATQLNTLVATLQQRLSEDPDGGPTEGWELLARTLANQGRNAEAANAWARIVEREDATSATWSQYAEALIAAEQGIVTEPAERAIDMALSLDPSNPAGTFYRAITLDQAGQTVDARKMLLERIAQESGFQDWMPFFLETANRFGAGFGLEPVGLPEFSDAPRGPSAADIEAAGDMTAEEQQAFVRDMVDGLATRLQDDPDDLPGWLQLARAYMVLGQRDDALAALRSAEPLVADLPADDPRRVTIEQGLEELGG